MNTGDKLIALQNSNRVIELLAAQRQLHSDAKAVYIAHGVISIVVPVIAALFPNASALVSVLAVVAPVALGRILVDRADAKQAEAASVQQVIDAILFGIEFPHVDYDRGLAARRSKSHIRRYGTGKLKNWYPDRIRGLASGEAEYECQGVNVIWTRNLSILSFLFDLTIVAIAAIAAVFGIQRSGGGSLAYVLLTPIIEWFVETMLDRYKLYRLVDRIKSSRDDLGNIDMECIDRVQELIYVYRCQRSVPDFIYAFSKNSEQGKADSSLI